VVTACRHLHEAIDEVIASHGPELPGVLARSEHGSFAQQPRTTKHASLTPRAIATAQAGSHGAGRSSAETARGEAHAEERDRKSEQTRNEDSGVCRDRHGFALLEVV
jgi:hypothetical protein